MESVKDDESYQTFMRWLGSMNILTSRTFIQNNATTQDTTLYLNRDAGVTTLDLIKELMLTF